MRHVLEVDDLGRDELTTVLDLADDDVLRATLGGRGVALVFEKPSSRTRVSMELAVHQLGGHPVALRDEEIGLDSRESVEDVARTLSTYCAVIGARVQRHSTVERMAAVASVPVVNLLSDDAHPCQALADVLTIRQCFGDVAGRSLAYVGDGNNVCRSLLLAGALTGIDMRVASPQGYEPPPSTIERARDLGGTVVVTHVPAEAVDGADAVYTDVWTSMGQEDDAASRRQAFAGFTIDAQLMAKAAPNALFLHCLPAHRGEEVTAAVVDGPQSVVWRQAANRLRAQRGLLVWLTESA